MLVIAAMRTVGRVENAPDGRPLDGVLVVALEQAVAAPLATRQLADLGARVIKIERPGRGDFARDYDSAAGDGMSSWFVWLNRAKQSVVLDLKTDEGRGALDRLIARADVFVCNLAPGAIRRLGVTAGELTARHPRLIACQLSGYAEEGPYAERKAYDLLVQAEAGVLAVTGTPGAPAKAGISVADIAGGMYAYSGILGALLQRERTGRGGTVTVSLLDALAEWMSHPLQLTRLTGRPPARTGARHATIVPYGGYQTADGDEVLLAVQNEAEWDRLCRRVLDLPGLADDARLSGNQGRVRHRDEVEQRLSAAVAELATGELLRRLDQARIAYVSVRSVEDVLAHPQLASRWTEIHAGDRPVDVLPPPVRHGGFDPVLGPVPAHGRDTEAVLAEFAADPDSARDGVIRPAVPGDADAIAAVHLGTWRDAYADILPAAFLDAQRVDEFAKRWRGRLTDPAERSFTLVYEQQGQVRAFASGGLSRDGDGGGEVYAIYVDPACQGRGAGARLLAAAARSLAGAGFTEAGLWAFAENHSARGFYEAQGWRHSGAPDAVKVGTFGGTRHTEVRYARPLDNASGKAP
jgi:itaconate CoA-transferase